MSVHTLPAELALTQLERFDTLIDARSPSEFALDHLPGARNWPTLDDAERIGVGTLYKQVNAFEARKRGAALAAARIAGHISREVMALDKSWQPLIYCWRGGQRSGALAHVLGQIGFRVTLIQGGYKAARAALVRDTLVRVAALRFQVVCGPTGSGKTRLLGALARAGAQVLDLEALAAHRSSVLGAWPGQRQPSQKAFERRIWDALRHFDAAHWVFIESESRKVGDLSVPPALIDAMRAAPCIDLRLSDAARVQVLLEDYTALQADVAYLCERLGALRELRGNARVQHWQALAQASDFARLTQELLAEHYDPLYRQSMGRNFSAYAQAQTWPAADAQPATLDALAKQLRATLGQPQIAANSPAQPPLAPLAPLVSGTAL